MQIHNEMVKAEESFCRRPHDLVNLVHSYRYFAFTFQSPKLSILMFPCFHPISVISQIMQ